MLSGTNIMICIVI